MMAVPQNFGLDINLIDIVENMKLNNFSSVLIIFFCIILMSFGDLNAQIEVEGKERALMHYTFVKKYDFKESYLKTARYEMMKMESSNQGDEAEFYNLIEPIESESVAGPFLDSDNREYYVYKIQNFFKDQFTYTYYDLIQSTRANRAQFQKMCLKILNAVNSGKVDFREVPRKKLMPAIQKIDRKHTKIYKALECHGDQIGDYIAGDEKLGALLVPNGGVGNRRKSILIDGNIKHDQIPSVEYFQIYLK